MSSAITGRWLLLLPLEGHQIRLSAQRGSALERGCEIRGLVPRHGGHTQAHRRCRRLDRFRLRSAACVGRRIQHADMGDARKRLLEQLHAFRPQFGRHARQARSCCRRAGASSPPCRCRWGHGPRPTRWESSSCCWQARVPSLLSARAARRAAWRPVPPPNRGMSCVDAVRKTTFDGVVAPLGPAQLGHSGAKRGQEGAVRLRAGPTEKPNPPHRAAALRQRRKRRQAGGEPGNNCVASVHRHHRLQGAAFVRRPPAV